MARAFLFSDLHCSTKHLSLVPELIKKEKADVLIFAGDVVNTGDPVWFAEKFIETMEKTEFPFLWVPGNNDFDRAYHKINSKFKSLEGRIVELILPLNKGKLDGVKKNDRIQSHRSRLGRAQTEARDDELLVRRFTGVGGSPASWAGQYQGESMVDRKEVGGSIFVSHYPPPGILILQQKDLSFPTDYRHSGFDPESSDGIPKQVRDDRPRGRRFSDAPLVHICGHLHYRWGTAFLGQTKVIQLASFNTGHYAMMDLDSLAVDFKRIR